MEATYDQHNKWIHILIVVTLQIGGGLNSGLTYSTIICKAHAVIIMQVSGCGSIFYLLTKCTNMG